MLRDTLLTAMSGNVKTGKIPVTYRTQETCPADCPFLPSGATGGCYGTGRLFGLARKHAVELPVAEAVKKVNEGASRAAKYLRDRVTGDVVTPDGAIDWEYLESISEVGRATRLRVFGYTHAWKLFSCVDVERLNGLGYVMNASCETLSEVEAAVSLGMPVVLANNDIPEGTIVAGKRVVTCPAMTRENVDCSKCGLCVKDGSRKAVVRFLIHGVARAKARRAVAEANA